MHHVKSMVENFIILILYIPDRVERRRHFLKRKSTVFIYKKKNRRKVGTL